MAAEALVPGSGAYHIACLMALLANESGCCEWLGKHTELNVLPEKEILLNETDFALVLNSKWFKQLTEPAPAPESQNK